MRFQAISGALLNANPVNEDLEACREAVLGIAVAFQEAVPEVAAAAEEVVAVVAVAADRLVLK